MIRVCSNAVQCHVTLARHRKLLLRLRRLVVACPEFYTESGHGVGAKVLAQCTPGTSDQFPPDGDAPGGAAADGEGVGEGGGEGVDVMALACGLEDLVLGDDEVEASRGLCNEFERTWLLSDAGPLSKAVKEAQKASKSGIDDMDG